MEEGAKFISFALKNKVAEQPSDVEDILNVVGESSKVGVQQVSLVVVETQAPKVAMETKVVAEATLDVVEAVKIGNFLDPISELVLDSSRLPFETKTQTPHQYMNTYHHQYMTWLYPQNLS